MTVRPLNRPARRACLALALLAPASLLGCQNDSGGARADAGRTQRASARVESTARPSSIPAGARLMGQGSSGLTFVTPGDGTVYLYDATDRRMVWSGPARARANIVVDPAADAVTVNDQQAGANIDPKLQQQTELDPSHQYQLWYATTGR